MSDHDDAQSIASILAGAHVAIVGTVSPSGAPHLTAVWFERREDDVVIMAPEGSRKVTNIEAEARVELCINTGIVGPCATAVGHAEVLGEADLDDLRRIATRYLGPQGAVDYVAARPDDAASVLIRIRPERWRLFPPTTDPQQRAHS